jgi:hypothetical protein
LMIHTIETQIVFEELASRPPAYLSLLGFPLSSYTLA